MITGSHLISIIVPIYNVERYLPQCIDSLIGQTYPCIEILLIDDGSTDDSGVIADSYAQRDERIVVIHQDNAGISAARNAGLEAMHGDFLMFVDGDDYVEVDFCKVALDLALTHQVDIVSFGYNAFWELSRNAVRKATRSPRLLEKQEAIQELITRRDVLYNFAWNKIYRVQQFADMRFPMGRSFEDVAVMHHIVERSSTGVYISDRVLYNYRRERHGSVVSSIRSEKVIHDRLLDEFERLEYVKKHYPEFENKQIAAVLEVCFQGLTLLPHRHEDRKRIKQFLKENKDKCLASSYDKRKMRLKAYYYMPPLFYLATLYVKLHYYK